MAFEIGRTLDKITSFEVAGIPVGAGVYYKAAEQVALFVSGMIGHFLPVPVIISDTAAAYLLKLPVVEDFLGKYGSHYASMAAVGDGIDKQFDISGKVSELLGKAETALTGGVSGAQAAVTSESNTTTGTAAATPVSGYVSGNVDIGDLANITSVYADQYKEAA